MRFDTLAGGDPIAGNSYEVEVGYGGPATPFVERIIQHTFIDGNINMFDIGTREEKHAELSFIRLTNLEFLDIQDFFDNNVGKKIKITEENDFEKIFMENFPSPAASPYYTYLLEVGQYQEEQFSVKRKTFRIKIKLALAGILSTDEINDSTGNLNTLIKINTVQSDIESTTAPSIIDGSSNPLPVGFRWNDTVNNKVFVHTGETVYDVAFSLLSWNPVTKVLFDSLAGSLFSGYTFKAGDKIKLESDPLAATLSLDAIPGVYGIAEKIDDDSIRLLVNDFSQNVEADNIRNAVPFEKLLYDVPADDTDLGFVNGVFYLASFFDMTAADTLIDDTWVSGVINYESVRFSGESININSGPDIARRQGFSFSVDDSNKFWNFIIENNIPLFGAKCELNIWRNNGGVSLNKEASGNNLTNQFSYTDYKFKIEPFLLNTSAKFPDKKIKTSEQRYKNVKTDVIGKSPYVTYGQFGNAALQNTSKTSSFVIVDQKDPPIVIAAQPDAQTQTLTGFINRNNNLEIFINNSGLLITDFGYTVLNDDFNDINNNSGFSIKILADTDSTNEDNIEQVRVITKIESIVDGFYTITISDAFPTTPPPSGTPLVKPFTDESIRFNILNSTYTFQMNEDPSGGFGVLGGSGSSGFVHENKDIKILSDNGKDLISIPTNGFIENADKNTIAYSLSGVNDPTAFTSFVKFGEELNVLIRELGSFIFFDDKYDVEFSDSGGPITGSLPIYTPSAKIKAAKIKLGIPQIEDIPGFLFPRASNGFSGGDPTFINNLLQERWTARTGVKLESILNNETFINYEYFGDQDNNNFISIWEHPIRHLVEIDEQLPANSNVKLGINLNLTIQSMVRHNVTAGTPGFNLRWDASGLKLIMRARRKDKTYFFNSGWEYELTSSEIGIGEDSSDPFTDASQNIGMLSVNCIPDGTAGGSFSETIQTPSSNWDYNVDYIYDNRIQRNTVGTDDHRFGDRAYIKDIPAIDRFDGTVWIDDDIAGIGDLTIGKKILHSYRTISDLFILDGTVPPLLVPGVEGADFERISKLQGRELFDLSPLFVSNDWADIESLEFLVLNRNTINTHGTAFGYKPYSEQFYSTNIELVEGPFLYKTEVINLEDRPTFSDVQGKIIRPFDPSVSSDFPNGSLPVTYDIINSIFPGKLDIPSLLTLGSQSLREFWLFRKQFITTQGYNSIIKDLLHNLWAVAVFDENDNLQIKTLNPDDVIDNDPNKLFTDSSIIKDSIKNIKFRDTNEIFNSFELGFDFDPVSDFTKAVPAYKKTNSLSDDPFSNIGEEFKSAMRNSKILYNVDNLYSHNYVYHYNTENLPFKEMVVNHFVYNAWTFDFTVSIDRVIGSTPIKMMDLVTIDSFFFTNNEVIKGFVIKRKLNVYKGFCTLTVFVQRPPGYLGPLCDSFKNALVTGRGTIPENDAGETGRTIGSFQQDDAGDSPRGIIDCN